METGNRAAISSIEGLSSGGIRAHSNNDLASVVVQPFIACMGSLAFEAHVIEAKVGLKFCQTREAVEILHTPRVGSSCGRWGTASQVNDLATALAHRRSRRCRLIQL
jgi:hypothetical protein